MNRCYYTSIFTILLAFTVFELYQSDPDLPAPKECGQQGFGNGSETPPWLVALAYWHPRYSRIEINCAGVLISKRHVIVQGECIKQEGDEILSYVLLGVSVANHSIAKCETSECYASAINIPIRSTWTRYSLRRKLDNIGVIRLSEDVTFTKWIQPICLPNVAVHRTITAKAAQFITLIWLIEIEENTSFENDVANITITRLKVGKRPITIDTDNLCASTSKGIEDAHSSAHYDSYTMLCSTKSDSCGDGPVLSVDRSDPTNPFWYLVGFMSRMDDCASQGLQLGTKIIPYLGWIFDKIES